MLLPLDNTFDYQGQSIAWGSIGKGEPVVMIHGFPWSAQAWRKIAQWVAETKTVYYFDMLGCGQSQKSDTQDVSPGVQNNLLAALIDFWNLDQPEVVAHDFGGLASLRGYYVNGLRYRKLTLIDAVAVLPSGSPFYRHVRKYEQAFAALPAYTHEALFHAYIQKASAKTIEREAVEIYARPWKEPVGQAAFYRQIAQSDANYIEEIQVQYGPMKQPVNLIWGEKDSFIPLNQAKELANLLSAEKLTQVPDAGHIIQEDTPEAVVAELLSN